MLVAVDPGHGGRHGRRDPGAVGLEPYELHEAEVVWPVCVCLASILSGQGHAILVTRSQRQFVSPAGRARLANDQGAELFVSVHCNSFRLDTANGFEVLFHPDSAQGRALALAIMDAMAEALGDQVRNRGIKPRTNLSVLTRTRMPAVLVELPFISNPRELEWLAELRNQAVAASAIARGLESWIAARAGVEA